MTLSALLLFGSSNGRVCGSPIAASLAPVGCPVEAANPWTLANVPASVSYSWMKRISVRMPSSTFVFF